MQRIESVRKDASSFHQQWARPITNETSTCLPFWIRRADCFDECTACGAASLRPVADSQGHLRTPLAVFRTSSCCDFAGTWRGYRCGSVLLGGGFEPYLLLKKKKSFRKRFWVWLEKQRNNRSERFIVGSNGPILSIVAGRSLRWFLHLYYEINEPDAHR